MQASHHRPRETPPEWCSQLVEVQQNASCRAPFTHIPATLAVPLTLSRDKYLRSVQRVNRGLSDAHTSLGGSTASMPPWMSGQGQDWWVWYNHARFLRRRGVYVDLATNDAIWRSNTYFFDACLGWGGLCIEASEVHYDRIKRERSCTLVPACVSNATNVSLTFSGGVGWRGGSSRLSAKSADPSAPLRSQDRRLRCRSLDDIFTSTTTKHVDVLSLDIEGHEVQALASANLRNTRIDIIISENPDVKSLLQRAGYRAQSSAHDHIFLRPGFELGIVRHGLRPLDGAEVPRCAAK